MALVSEREQRLAEQKVALDYVKHISALATTVIVVSVAFLESLTGVWATLPMLAMCLQFVSLVMLSLAAVGVISAGRSALTPSGKVVSVTLGLFLVGMAAFLGGIGALVIYAVRNMI